MPDIHSIRLREPWQCEPRSESVVWVRIFNWPAGLTRREKVWIVIEPRPEGAQISLNGERLAETLEVTQSLALYNRLEIELPGAPAGELPFAVRLDIDEG